MIRVALAQINATVGDLSGNTERIRLSIERAREKAVDLLVFPELTITGYPPEDLLLKPRFIDENLKCLRSLIPASKGMTIIVGFVDRQKGRDGRLLNAAALLSNGMHRATYAKQCLPNYGVFDELRYFAPGDRLLTFNIKGVRFGLSICEDMWRGDGPVRQLIRQKRVQAVVNINASPYHAGKWKEREALIRGLAKRGHIFFFYVNMVGGQDELVFDGHSVVMARSGKVLAYGKQFAEDLVVWDLDGGDTPLLPTLESPLAYEAEVYAALVLGTRDYVRKNGFQKVVIGSSGGIDSALVAAIATDALGSKNVVTVSLPSPFSSQGSIVDARRLANNLGIEHKEIAIGEIFELMKNELAPHFAGCPEDITEENLQARIRGLILMALSNKFGWLVLTTGNKSEMSTGYATLYGDMAGGFAVIKDVPKTLVYRLARHRNVVAGKDLIPETILTKAPSAELRPNQTDQDSLPPYDILDPIMQAYVEEDRHFDEIVRMGFDPATVRKVIGLIDKSEYKRRQAPPGVKITPRAFGKDWRLPITNRFAI